MTQAIVPKELLTATLGGLSLLVVSGGADGHVLTQQADGAYAPEAPSAGIGGSVGSVTNRLVKSSGTGGSTVQSTGITVDGSDNVSGVGAIDCGSVTATGSGFSAGIAANGAIGGYFRTGLGSMGIAAGAIIPADPSGQYGGTDGAYLGIGLSYWRWGNLFAGSADFKGSLTASGAFNIAPITKSALLLLTPTAATAGRWRVTDATPANREAYPDGTDWRYTSDDSVVT